MDTLEIKQPDDWHLHLRDENYLARTVKDTSAQFARAIVMPNLKPAVQTIEHVDDYLQRISHYIDTPFQPLMTLYLTEQTTPEIIQQAKHHPHTHAVKLYPAGATTHSDQGVHNVRTLWPTFEAMQTHRFPLLIHGEVNDTAVDIFDREAVFIDTVLQPLCEQFPELPIVLEHITTKTATQYIKESTHPIGATITAHHLWLNRNDLLAGGIKPHYYCLPVVKRDSDRLALIEAATGGNEKFFLGTDSAPHTIHAKQSACGCAGIYTAHNAMELYTEIFEQAGALDKLEGFASVHGPKFYGMPVNETKIRLVKIPTRVPKTLDLGDEQVIPFAAGTELNWTFEKKGG